MLHEIADGEVGRIALAAVAELLAEPERLLIGAVERLHPVAEAGERAREQCVVGERETAEQDGRRRAVGSREDLRIGIAPVLDRRLVEAELPALGRLVLAQLTFDGFVVQQGVAHGRASVGICRWNTMAMTTGSGGAMSRRSGSAAIAVSTIAVSSSR